MQHRKYLFKSSPGGHHHLHGFFGRKTLHTILDPSHILSVSYFTNDPLVNKQNILIEKNLEIIQKICN